MPKFTHDCPHCILIGEDSKNDYYFCPNNGSLIARKSSEASDYVSSNIRFADIIKSNSDFGQAYQLYEAWRASLQDKKEAPVEDAPSKKSVSSTESVSPTPNFMRVGARHGWYCPRCRKINSPFLQQCLCSEETERATTVS